EMSCRSCDEEARAAGRQATTWRCSCSPDRPVFSGADQARFPEYLRLPEHVPRQIWNSPSRSLSTGMELAVTFPEPGRFSSIARTYHMNMAISGMLIAHGSQEPSPQTASRLGRRSFAKISTSSTVIGVLKVARGFFVAHSRCTTETIASCSSAY